MKTLDEVIKIFSAFATYQPELYEGPAQSTVADAVHYLKEYKKKWLELQNLTQENLFKTQKLNDRIARYEEAIKNCEEAENKYRKMKEDCEEAKKNYMLAACACQNNLPLTWDELKKMEDRPVWIVESNIVFDDECDVERKGHWDIIKKVYPEQITFYVQGMSNHKSWQGIGWQAFRKEI